MKDITQDPNCDHSNALLFAKHAYEKNITLKESAGALNILSEKDFDKLVNPADMIAPNKKSPF